MPLQISIQRLEPLVGRWIGLKMIMYNEEQNGKTIGKLEIWVDKNNDGNWEKNT